MFRWVLRTVLATSYWGIGLLMAIENVVLPLPSELIMPLGGFLAGRGRMTLWEVIVFGTAGSVLGALPLYYVARAVGEERLTRWVERHGRWLMLRRRDLQKAHDRFAGRNFSAVAIAQIIPGIRGLISVPAGFARMNVAAFLLANLLGTVVWCAVLAVAGDELGVHFARIHKLLGPVGWIVLGAVLAAAIVFEVRRRRRAARAAA